ncbi:MAG: hypothetical protein M3265_01695 [Actinomycetota bacterium]|nr:hypothetical protein [Actinomycetota bacterium]
MPNERERVRLEVTFKGGHAIAVLVATDAADGLRRALEGERDAVFELEADDGRYFIPLRNVVYVKRFSRDTQIGFGGTA